MTATVRKALIGALAAWTFGAGLMMTASPSLAQGWRGGWHGGYWGRGGWGAGAGDADFMAGGAACRGGLALSTLAGTAYASSPYYSSGYSWQNRPVYDSWAILRAMPLFRSAIEVGLDRASWGARRQGLNFFSIFPCSSATFSQPTRLRFEDANPHHARSSPHHARSSKHLPHRSSASRRKGRTKTDD